MFLEQYTYTWLFIIAFQ